MKLTAGQLEQFEREGYLFFPGMFRPDEVRILLDEVPRLYAQQRPENVREKGSDAVRTNFAAHLSPWNRVAVYLSLCAVSNHIRRFKRPEYIAHRDFAPLECLPDDCLLRDYEVPLPWRNGTPPSALQPQLAA